MSTWFTSDLHFGSENMATKWRGFASADEAAYTITENINGLVRKQEKLYILGDVIDNNNGIKWANNIRCRNVELLLGNHDKLKLSQYFAMGWKITGFRKYNNFWISHCPIHPNEIRKTTGNLHGHCHITGDTEDITDPRYFNVNTEYHSFQPVNFEAIENIMEARNDKI